MPGGDRRGSADLGLTTAKMVLASAKYDMATRPYLARFRYVGAAYDRF